MTQRERMKAVDIEGEEMRLKKTDGKKMIRISIIVKISSLAK